MADGVGTGFAGGIYLEAICDIVDLMHAQMGGFLFSSALIVGVIAAAFGSFSQIKTAAVVAVGSFAIISVVSMHEAFSGITCASADGPGTRDVAASRQQQDAQTEAAQKIIREGDSPVAFNPAFADDSFAEDSE